MKARMCERVGRYQDMVNWVSKTMDLYSNREREVPTTLRNLLSVAFNGCVGQLRKSCRVLKLIEQTELAKNNSQPATCAKEYILKIQKEISTHCKKALEYAESMYAFPSDRDIKVFLLKMRGDFSRYLAELRNTEDFEKRCGDATRFYDEALKVGLPADHHLVLGVQLNKAIFVYEVQNNRPAAINVLKKALQEAGIRDYKRGQAVTVNLVIDNLKSWESNQGETIEICGDQGEIVRVGAPMQEVA